MRRLKIVIPVVTVLLGVLIGSGLILPRAKALSGNDFKPAHIIDDSVFFNSSTMNAGDIQNFLNAKVPTCDTNGTQPSGRSGYATRADWGRANNAPPPYICVKNYTQTIPSTAGDAYCSAIVGGSKTAASIINDVARACGVNPQTLIVLLQKEQTLISDDWPWPIQYRSATGYGCPDTAACDSQYYGFYNQVYNAARQFKRYVQQPGSYNYAVGRNSYILYNPNSSCGGTNLTIENKATAALYNYTPYQPNRAALNNLYGTGDSCSAYGNRNFWRMFNDWFGSTSGNGYVLAKSDDPNDLRQWVIYGTIKQYVPSGEIKRAWNLPETPTEFNAAYLDSISTGPSLDRLFTINGGSTLYFVDNGLRYTLPSSAYLDLWNLRGKVISSVSLDLANTPIDSGMLKPYIKVSGSSTLYMLDGSSGSQTKLRPYASGSIFSAIEGDAAVPLTISTDLYSYLNATIGTTLSKTRFTNAGDDYMVFNGARRILRGGTASLYPAAEETVSASAIERLPYDGQMTYMLQAVSNNTFYIVDNGEKRAVATNNLANAWQAPGLPIMRVNDNFLSTIPNGPALSTYTADVGGQLYIMNIRKKRVSAGVDAAYRRALPPTAISETFAALFPDDNEPATRFFQEQGTPFVYLISNTGTKYKFATNNTFNILKLWGAYDAGIPLIPGFIAGDISQTAEGLSVFVGDGTTEYLMSNAKKLSLNAQAKQDWGLGSPLIMSDGTLEAFTTGAAVSNMFIANGAYYIVKQGTGFGTVDASIARAWNITASTDSDIRLMSTLITRYASLTRFVRSNWSNDYTMYLVDKGIWHRLRWEHFINLGGPNVPTMVLAPDDAITVDDWLSPVIKSEAGTYYVVDSGGIRNFPAQMIIDQWTGWGSLRVNTISNDLINQMPYRGIIERTVKGSAPAVYTIINGQKRWILYPETYNRYYAPYKVVGDALIYALDNGPSI